MSSDKRRQRLLAVDDVTLDELTALCEIMVSLAKAGVPLDRGLLNLAQDLPGRLGAQAAEISTRLQSGTGLANVVSSEGSAFPPVYASVVEAGIRSGRTTAALEGFARLARQLAELRALVVSSLVYPMMLMVVLAVVSVAVLRQMPTALGAFLDDHYLGTESARNYAIFMNVYQWTAQWFWLVPVALIGVGVFWILATRSANAAQGDGRDWIAWVPGANRLLRNSRLLAFTDVLFLLVEQQVPLHEAVRLAGSASGDRDLRADAEQLAGQMEQGASGSRTQPSVHRRGVPAFLRWGLCNHQRIGSLESTLDRARRMYRYRTEDSATWLRTLLPVCISFGLGGLTALLYVVLFLVPWYAVLRLIAEPLRFDL
jgi:type II secretory pathway component PulF